MNKQEECTISGVILDLDGLILDTERPSIPVWLQAGKAFGLEVKEETAFRAIGITGEDIRKLVRDEYGTDFPCETFLDLLDRLVDEEFEKGIALRPGFMVLLECLNMKKIPYAVATSSSRKYAFWKLEKAGLSDRFPLLVGGDEVENGKPAPDIFLKAAALLNLKPAECIGFEDSVAGLRGLHDAGIRPVFVKDIVEPPDDVLTRVWRRYWDLAEAADDLF